MKNLKTIVLVSLLTIGVTTILAQRPKEIKNREVKGLFLSFSDFKNGNLALPTDNQHKGDKIKLKQFCISPKIVSIEQGNKTVFYKDSIFAIQLINGENYRFINLTPCLVADTSYLYIYTHKTTKTKYKQSGPTTRTKETPITYYYFSTDNHKTVYRLTLENLLAAVLYDATLYKAIHNKFTTNEMLYEINPKTGNFVLNETLLTVK